MIDSNPIQRLSQIIENLKPENKEDGYAQIKSIFFKNSESIIRELIDYPGELEKYRFLQLRLNQIAPQILNEITPQIYYIHKFAQMILTHKIDLGKYEALSFPEDLKVVNALSPPELQAFVK